MSFSGDAVGSSRNLRKAVEFGKAHVVRPKGKHQATIVWLHGLGDKGSSWSQLLETLPLPNVSNKLQIKWICPSAPSQLISLFGGFPSTACGAKGLLLNNLGVYGGCQVLFNSQEVPGKLVLSANQHDKSETIDLSFAKGPDVLAAENNSSTPAKKPRKKKPAEPELDFTKALDEEMSDIFAPRKNPSLYFSQQVEPLAKQSFQRIATINLRI